MLVASFDAADSGMINPTIVRTRGVVGVRPATGIETDVEITGAFGLAVVSDRAFAAGVASVPGPFTDASWDGWFVWHSFTYALEASAGATPTAVLDMANRLQVDSKAMRKISDEETIVLVAESQTNAFRIDMPLRLLMKLS